MVKILKNIQQGQNVKKYPKISVKLVGEDGNAFAIIGKVVNAVKKAKIDNEEIKAFTKEALSGDYNHLLSVVMSWVEVK